MSASQLLRGLVVSLPSVFFSGTAMDETRTYRCLEPMDWAFFESLLTPKQ